MEISDLPLVISIKADDIHTYVSGNIIG